MMAASALGVKAAPFTYAAHALAAAAAVMVLVWCVHFRGGLALEAENKNLIFNVSDSILCPCLFFVSLQKLPPPAFRPGGLSFCLPLCSLLVVASHVRVPALRTTLR
jgi:hypothetical protein